MNLNDLRVGTRLGSGFFIILLLMIFMAGAGIWRLGSVASASRAMMDVPLAKERLTEEFFRNNAMGVVRSKAIAKGSDPVLAAQFADDSKAASARGNEIVKALSQMPTSAEEQKLMDDINAKRKAYVAARDAITQARQAGNVDEANRIFDGDFAATAPAYIASNRAYLDYQHQAIDQVARAVDADAAKGEFWLGAISALGVLASVALAWILTRSMTGPVARAARLADAVAAGDLSQSLKVEGRDELAALTASLVGMNRNLHDLVGKVRRSADSIATASTQIAQGNHDLSQRTEQQAAALEETAASMEELSSTVQQNAGNAMQANQLALSASDVAIKGGEVVGQVVETMKDINDSSRKIADIIGVIDGIAFQTNILALNAAVEAARAGEQGRGFAVVASEVRSLARRSADAAKEIKTLITASVERVEHGSSLVDQAGTTMIEVVSSIKRVTDIMGEISAASSEQSAGVAQVGTAVTQMDQATQQNAALVEESAAAAESLKTQARDLVDAVAVFRLDR
jgi:methyl-accepting chemotaxis protein